MELNGNYPLISRELIQKQMEKWNRVSFVMGSKYRREVLTFLANERPVTPKQISDSLNISMSHVSGTLSSLEEKGLVECLTPDRHRYRLYRITEDGKEFITYLVENGFLKENTEANNNNKVQRWTQPEENYHNSKSKPVYQRPTYPKKYSDNKYLAVDLFCGPGGLSQGLEQAGFNVILGTDIHKPSIKTYRMNHPYAHTILGDMRKVEGSLILKALSGLKIDLVAAGIPCEGFSLSSKKRNDKDERNFLFLEFLRAVEIIQPTNILIENVANIKAAAKGAFVDEIITALNILDYNVESKILNAVDFGVPQERRRIFFYGSKHEGHISWPLKTHGVKGGPKYVTVKNAIGDLPSLKNRPYFDFYDKEPFSDYQKIMRENCSKLTNHLKPKSTRSTIERIKNTKPGEPMYESFKQRIRLHPDKPSPTIVSGGIRPQFLMGHPWEDRGLTVRERARIQSFQDRFNFTGGRVQGRVQTGQAIPPLLAKALGSSIMTALAR